MIKSIITDIKFLRKPCAEVTKNDDYKSIITDLKDTLKAHPEGIGLSANQIGYNKKISYIRVPVNVNAQTKQIEYNEFILINPIITEKMHPVKVQNEGCLSFHGVHVTTKRYIYCAVDFYDENWKLQTVLMQDLESLACLHEYDHLLGKTIFDAKWKAK